MTDEERYIAQGRARDAAKALRAEIATLEAFFEEYRESLEDAKGALARFLSDPRTISADGRPLIDHVNNAQRKLSESGFFEKTAELLEATAKLQKLEEKIKEF